MVYAQNVNILFGSLVSIHRMSVLYTHLSHGDQVIRKRFVDLSPNHLTFLMTTSPTLLENGLQRREPNQLAGFKLRRLESSILPVLCMTHAHSSPR